MAAKRPMLWMEVLENLEVERQQIDRVNELLELKDSLQQQLTKSTIKQAELRESCRKVPEATAGEDIHHDLQELLLAYRLLGVSVKSLAQNLILEFTPASTNQSSSSESYILEIERQKDSWTVVQHSLPPFIPVAQLREDSDSDLKVLVASISDYLYAYYQRREALHLVKKRLGNYLVNDVEVNLPVTYIQLELCLSQQPNKNFIQIRLEYNKMKTLPDNVELKSDFRDKQLGRWLEWLKNDDLYTAVNSIVQEHT